MSDGLNYLLKEMAEFIKQKFGACKVILFGSYAYGNPTQDSDIDLLVITETEKRPPKLGAEIKISLRKNFHFFKPMDILVRNSEFIKKRLEENDSFIKEIVQKGIEL